MTYQRSRSVTQDLSSDGRWQDSLQDNNLNNHTSDCISNPDSRYTLCKLVLLKLLTINGYAVSPHSASYIFGLPEFLHGMSVSDVNHRYYNLCDATVDQIDKRILDSALETNLMILRRHDVM